MISMINQKNIFVKILGIVMVFVGVVLFLFLDIYQGVPNSMSVEEKVDVKIRYSVFPLGNGFD